MGTTIISTGTVSVGLTIGSGDVLSVQAGGTASSTVVENGGLENILPNGSSVNDKISSGGAMYDSGSATGASVTTGGLLMVSSGGVASNTKVSSGGLEAIYPGATVLDVAVSSGGKVRLFGSVNSLTTQTVTTNISVGQTTFITIYAGGVIQYTSVTS
jgi:autotransporter passenger strand-loop-strand repeat protein